MVRRSVALGVGVLVLILFVLGVRGCLDSRKQSAIESYVADVDALMEESNDQSEALFGQLQGGDGSTGVDVLNALNSFRVQSAQLVDRASALDTPGELAAAQRQVVDTLAFRRDGIAGIANAVQASAGDEQEGAADSVAQSMQLFLASDQIYAARVTPEIDAVLQEEGVRTDLTQSQFLPDIIWLDPTEVAGLVSGIGTGGGEAAPGLHGNGLGTVTLGGQTLTPGGSNTIAAADDLTFEVQVANQGENTETDVTVRVTLGQGGGGITRETVLDTIAAGETKSVSIPLDETPPTGQNVPINVEIEPVAGEEKTDNNSADFTVIFTS
jgi:hypothetical protein